MQAFKEPVVKVTPSARRRAQSSGTQLDEFRSSSQQLPPVPLTQPSIRSNPSRSKSNQPRANPSNLAAEKPITIRNIDPAELVPLTFYPESLWSNFKAEINRNRDLFMDCFNNQLESFFQFLFKIQIHFFFLKVN